MRKWVVRYSPVYKFPGREWMIALPLGTRVETTGQVQTIQYRNCQTKWEEITVTFATKTWQGWIYSPLIEDYFEEYPEAVVIEHPTISQQDAAQYAIWRGAVQYNLCGELCVAYIVEQSIETVLAKWETGAPAAYKSAFNGGAGRTTGISDLESILKLYGYPVPCQTYVDILRDPVLALALVTPGRLSNVLQAYQIILRVTIDGATGDLKQYGTAHWVVLERCTPSGANHGWVELYNPFVNRIQLCSWGEFVAASMLTGALIKRG
jgi:hypothetical protein